MPPSTKKNNHRQKKPTNQNRSNRLSRQISLEVKQYERNELARKERENAEQARLKKLEQNSQNVINRIPTVRTRGFSNRVRSGLASVSSRLSSILPSRSSQSRSAQLNRTPTSQLNSRIFGNNLRVVNPGNASTYNYSKFPSKPYEHTRQAKEALARAAKIIPPEPVKRRFLSAHALFSTPRPAWESSA